MKVAQVSTQDVTKRISKKVVSKPVQQTISNVSGGLEKDAFIKNNAEKRPNIIRRAFNRVFVDSFLFLGLVGFMFFLRYIKKKH